MIIQETRQPDFSSPAPVAQRQVSAMGNRVLASRWMGSATFVAIALAAFLLVGLVDCAAESTFLGFQLSKNTPIRGLTIPFIGENADAPSVRLLIEEVSVEKRKSGNMVFGVLPQIVIRGMKIEVLGQNGSTEWLSLLCNFAAKESAIRGSKIKEFELLHKNQDGPVVKAETAGFNMLDATLQLRQVSVCQGGHCIRTLKSARIPMNGPQAGELLWKEGEQTKSISLNKSASSNHLAAATTPY